MNEAKRCFFCIQAIEGERAEGWDLVYQTPVCGLCLKRVALEQKEIYNPLGQNLFDNVRGGEWVPKC